MMAVSTPGSSKVRCYDCISGVECPGVSPGEASSAGEIHGLTTVTRCRSSAADDLVWITENDTIHSRPWTTLGMRNDETEGAFFLIERMKQTSKPFIIAESKAAEGDSDSGKSSSKAWVYWHEGRDSPKCVSDDPPRRSSWAMQCRWNDGGNSAVSKHDDAVDSGDAFHSGDGAIIPLPFLTSDDVIDLVQRRDDSNATRGAARAVMSKDFVAIVIPTYSMVYIYAREDMMWRHIDLQEEGRDIESCIAINVDLLDSWLFVLSLDGNARNLSVRACELSSIFADEVHHIFCCYMPAQHINNVSMLAVHAIADDTSSFAVSCIANLNDEQTLVIWELLCSDGKFVVGEQLVCSPPFPSEGMKAVSVFRLSKANGAFPEHQDSSLITSQASGRDDDLVVEVQFQRSTCFCLPRLNLWRPI